MASKKSCEFNCDCGKAYTNENNFNSALKLHQATKHGEKIYSKISESPW